VEISISDFFIIDAEPTAVFNLLADLESYPQWLQQFPEVNLIAGPATDQGEGVNYYEAKVDLGPISDLCQFRVSVDQANSAIRISLYRAKLIGKFDLQLTVAPAKDQPADGGKQKTNLGVKMALTTSLSVPQFIAQQYQERFLAQFLSQLQDRLQR
jgi:hypothetical protein